VRFVAGSIRTTREGVASSSRPKNWSSTPVAVREKRLKLTPPSATVAPSGELRPTGSVLLITVSSILYIAHGYPGSLGKTGDMVPQADDRLITAVVLEPEYANTGR